MTEKYDPMGFPIEAQKEKAPDHWSRPFAASATFLGFLAAVCFILWLYR
jgi:hypothetical protein